VLLRAHVWLVEPSVSDLKVVRRKGVVRMVNNNDQRHHNK